MESGIGAKELVVRKCGCELGWRDKVRTGCVGGGKGWWYVVIVMIGCESNGNR